MRHCFWNRIGISILAAFAAGAAHGAAPAAARSVLSTEFASGNSRLRVEVLSDTLVHFEFTAKPLKPGRIPSSPMVYRTDFDGPTEAQRDGQTLSTPNLSFTVEPSSLCFTLSDRYRQALTNVCPKRLADDWKGLTLSRESTRNLYGLGQQFRTPGRSDGDWMGAVRTPGEINGNRMVPFNGGNNGNTQIPILYALGPVHARYAFFLDSVYKQQWDFRRDPWLVETWGDSIRGYLFVGDDLPALRRAYLDLVGRPLVPPKKVFGMWVSEYGYRDWAHMESKLATLRQHRFPIDGFMLDLFWYGGVAAGSDDSPMGKMAWDPVAFPDARAKLKSLRDNDGIGVIPIEESYVARNLPEHRDLAARGFLVKDPSGAPAYVNVNPWWGKGGLIDWSNPPANDYWHRLKRVALIEDGVTGLWTDLGEPEVYPQDGRYVGGREADVHNLFNLYWLQGIYQGYRRYTPTMRPFMVSRSGTAGLQRFGAGMWSGDIGSDLTSLAAHLNAQMHLSLSGVDYYGADIGGFKREALHGDLNESYTKWFATGTLFDVPVRPHTENLCRCKETAPDRVGDLASNLANLRQRYQLIPYLYSLAHRAHQFGEPVFPPLVYHFESDPNAREIGGEKMIGPWLVARAVAEYGAKTTDVYLPAGLWYDFHDETAISSRGQRLPPVPLYRDGKLVPPVYARAGAIVPLMTVDDATMNALGKRLDGARHDELRARFYAGDAPTRFELVEDDGETTAYLNGSLRRTPLAQVTRGKQWLITVGAAQGTYADAPTARDNFIELVGAGDVSEIRLNGQLLPTEDHPAPFGWWREGGRVIVRTGVLPVNRTKELTVSRG